MNIPRLVTTTAVLLALAGLGVALYQGIEARRAAEVAAENARERDALRTRVAVLERNARASAEDAAAAAARVTTLEKELAALREKAVPARPLNFTATQPIARAAVDDAKVQQEKARLHRRYGSLLQQRGLTPAQAERFIDLMFEKDRVREDVQAAVEKMNADGHHPDVQALRSRLDGPLWDEMKSLLGPGGMEAFSEHEELSFFRMGFIDPMRDQFRNAGAELTPEQENQLVQILRANRSSQRGKSTDIGSVARFAWDEIVAQANAVLSPAQRPIFGAEISRHQASRR